MSFNNGPDAPRRANADRQSRLARQRVVRRRRIAVALALLLVVALPALTWWRFSGATHSVVASSTTTSTSSTVVTSTTTTTAPPSTTTTLDTNLPQTSSLPPSSNAQLSQRLTGVWKAIAAGNAAPGASLFFPQSVYVTMKSGILSNPASDWEGRLWAFYRLDVPAYHALVHPGAVYAGVIANGSYAAWIPPGVCENHFGYWHLPNVRILYHQGPTLRSFAVASLISYRGQWFVVHLGPNPRSSDVGTVALPANGAGTPGPPGGC